MKFLFRADGNEQIGMGHIMRCLSIAQKAKEQGIDCVFLIADGACFRKIMDAGIKCIILGTDFQNLEDEIPKLKDILVTEKPDKVIVDSYYVTKRYLKTLKEISMFTLVYIDDIASFAYPVDVLINYNSYALTIDYASMYKLEEVSQPQLLLGLPYVPLRAEFQDVNNILTKDFVEDILVSVGGSDSGHIMIGIIKYLLKHQELTENKFYHFIIGDFEPDQEEILSMASVYPWIITHQKVKEMAKLMLSCDIAISAAGSTLYELCACGIPTITYILADNQVSGARFFGENKIMLLAGDFRYEEDCIKELFKAVKILCMNKELRNQMKEKARTLVNGNGAEEIVNVLCNFS